MKILIEESVLRQALDVLVSISREMVLDPLEARAITALRSALDVAEKVEPFAWAIYKDGELYRFDVRPDEHRTCKPLYEHPAPKPGAVK